jgi:hypothetical protein
MRMYRLVTLLSAAGMTIGLAGCSSSPTTKAAQNTVTTTSAATTTSASTATTTSTLAPSTTTAPTSVPTLGQPVGNFAQGQGFGEVKPSTVFNGGDPTGYVSDITWNSWGGSTAEGDGISDYVGPNQSVAQGTQEPVTIIAFQLGTCGGKLMYQAVEWYFPQHGGAFDPNQYEDICNGTYYPPTP